MKRYTGGCLCGALRYEATGEPLYAGHCYCADCRKASGSGFIPFIGVARSEVSFSGQVLKHRSKARSGGDAVRNSCAACGGLVFGGELGESTVSRSMRAPWTIRSCSIRLSRSLRAIARHGLPSRRV